MRSGEVFVSPGTPFVVKSAAAKERLEFWTVSIGADGADSTATMHANRKHPMTHALLMLNWDDVSLAFVHVHEMRSLVGQPAARIETTSIST
jgi:hypothetical protein